MPSRMIANSAVYLVLLFPSSALAQPSPQQKRVQEAAKAIEECAKKSCDAAEMKKKFADLERAREALDASLTAKTSIEKEAATPPGDGSDAPSTDPDGEHIEIPLSPAPAPPQPKASWMAPPEYRAGAASLPPPDTRKGGVRMRREHLGNYWMGLGLLTGGLVGLAASAGFIADNAEGARDFSDLAPGVVLGVINLSVVIAGAALFVEKGELVPESSARIEPTSNGLAFRF